MCLAWQSADAHFLVPLYETSSLWAKLLASKRMLGDGRHELHAGSCHDPRDSYGLRKSIFPYSYIPKDFPISGFSSDAETQLPFRTLAQLSQKSMQSPRPMRVKTMIEEIFIYLSVTFGTIP